MYLKKRLLSLAYALEASQTYKKVKFNAYEILEDHTSDHKKYFDFFMIFLVFSTILILILEIKNTLPPFVYTYETIAVVIFILEWLGRLWVSSSIHESIISAHEKFELEESESSSWMLLKPALSDKVRFIISPMSIIDLLAILPSYRPLRILRFFLLFRLFKVFRYTQSLNFLLKVFVEKRYEFLTLLMIFTFMVFFASTVIYIFEGNGSNDKINNFFDAIYWAVITITTVGYGDIAPQTLAGRLITTILIVGGIAIISFMTSIITTSMTEKMQEVKEQQVLNAVAKLKSFILICGFGKMGKELARELHRANEAFVIVDKSEDEIALAKKENFLALCADATDIEVLKELKCDTKMRQAVTLTTDDALNLSIIMSLKSLNPDNIIFSRVNNKEAKVKLEMAGAQEGVFPFNSAAKAALAYYEKPIAYTALDNILIEQHNPVIEEIEISRDSKASDQFLNQIGIKGYNLKVLGVVRTIEEDKFYFHPDADMFILIEHDILIVIGDREDTRLFKLSLFKG